MLVRTGRVQEGDSIFDYIYAQTEVHYTHSKKKNISWPLDELSVSLSCF